MGVSVLLEQDPQARQRNSDDSKVEPMKPSTVGTGVIVWVGKADLFLLCRLRLSLKLFLPTGWRPLRRKAVGEWMRRGAKFELRCIFWPKMPGIGKWVWGLRGTGMYAPW